MSLGTSELGKFRLTLPPNLTRRDEAAVLAHMTRWALAPYGVLGDGARAVAHLAEWLMSHPEHDARAYAWAMEERLRHFNTALDPDTFPDAGPLSPMLSDLCYQICCAVTRALMDGVDTETQDFAIGGDAALDARMGSGPPWESADDVRRRRFLAEELMRETEAFVDARAQGRAPATEPLTRDELVLLAQSPLATARVLATVLASSVGAERAVKGATP